MPRWSVAQLACASQGFVVTPIYETIGANAMTYVINHSGVNVIFTSEANSHKIINARSNCTAVTDIIVMDGGGDDADGITQASGGGVGSPQIIPPESGDCCASGKLRVHSWAQLTAGKSPKILSTFPPNPAGFEDTALIMYTSGTTGAPKGVQLSNRALVASVASVSRYAQQAGFPIGTGSSTLSYLPLAHVLEQTAEATFMSQGGCVGYYSGSIKDIAKDLEDFRPTVFLGVPQVYKRFADKLKARVASSSLAKRAAFHIAYQIQKHAVRKGKRSALADRLVFNKIRNKFFPRTEFCISGAAPLNAETQEFLQVIFGCPVIQGYGLTETCAGIAIQFPYSGYGSCGSVLCGAQVKLKDVPEMNYTSNLRLGVEEGEILVRGPLLASGYYRDEQKTTEAWDSEGWFLSGDIGRFNRDGSLAVIDRKKSMFKLAQGEYVSPENLEAVLGRSEWVKQVWVYGDPSERYVVCVVVPSRKTALAWGRRHGLASVNYADVCANPQLKQEVLLSLQAEVSNANLPAFQRPIRIHLETDINDMEQGFTLEKGMVTPTMKYKRPIMQKLYAKEIDAMYKAAAKGR